MSDENIQEENAVLDAIADEFDEALIDPEAVFDETQDVLEARGIAGDSFWELRRGERFADFSERVAPHLQRDAVFWWHVLRQSDGNWTHAYFLGPQLACLGAAYNTGLLSTITEEDFSEISYLFPLDTLDENVQDYQARAADSPFYERYSRQMAETFAYLAQDFADRGTEWALEAIYDEVLKSMVVVRIAARDAYRAFDEMAAESGKQAPEGTEMIGVANVDENWIPNAFIGLHGAAEARMQREAAISQIKAAVGQVVGDDVPEVKTEFPDDEILSVLMLQCYIWTGRSWNKVPEKISDMFYGAMCYVKTLLGPRPDFADNDPEARRTRLDELAAKFDDGNGGYELEADDSKPPIEGFDEDGNPTVQYALTPESAEFMNLMQQEQILAQLDVEEQVAVKFSQNMPSCRDNVHSLLSEEIASCLRESIDMGIKFEQAFDEIAHYLDERKDSLLPQAKSHWKKYLKANPAVAAAAKRGELIVELDDNGNPIFSGDYIAAIREEDENVTEE